MDPGMWYDDDALMEGLTEAVARERTVPEHVMQAAKDTFDWRGVDAELELLTLSFDSLLTDAVGVRGPAPDSPRMLVFDGDGSHHRDRGGARRAHGSGRACQIRAGHLAVC